MSCLVDKSDGTGGKVCNLSEESSGLLFAFGGKASSGALQEHILQLQFWQISILELFLLTVIVKQSAAK